MGIADAAWDMDSMKDALERGDRIPRDMEIRILVERAGVASPDAGLGEKLTGVITLLNLPRAKAAAMAGVSVNTVNAWFKTGRGRRKPSEQAWHAFWKAYFGERYAHQVEMFQRITAEGGPPLNLAQMARLFGLPRKQAPGEADNKCVRLGDFSMPVAAFERFRALNAPSLATRKAEGPFAERMAKREFVVLFRRLMDWQAWEGVDYLMRLTRRLKDLCEHDAESVKNIEGALRIAGAKASHGLEACWKRVPDGVLAVDTAGQVLLVEDGVPRIRDIAAVIGDREDATEVAAMFPDRTRT